MPKRKLQRFEELKELKRIIQPEGLYLDKFHELRGNWNKKIFRNNNPITLELGCGKGEYTIGMAKKYPKMNDVFMSLAVLGNPKRGHVIRIGLGGISEKSAGLFLEKLLGGIQWAD